MAEIGFDGGSNGDLICASHSADPVFDSATEDVAIRQRHERWSKEDRARITAESFTSGSSVSAVARRHGVSLGLLHYWRRKVRDSGRVEELRFVPVAVDAQGETRGPGSIEIEVGDVRIALKIWSTTSTG
jgi:transposase